MTHRTMTHRMMTRRLAVAIATVLGVTMTLTGCAPTGKDLFTQAQTVNTTAKQAVAELQLYLHDGPWHVGTGLAYGERPDPCGADGYVFKFTRSTIGDFDAPWRLPQGTVDAQAEDITAWLEEHGWSGIVFRSYTGGVTDVTITTRKPDAYIDDLLITIGPGEATDSINLRTTTTCEPGNATALFDLMFPDGGWDYTSPQSEHPSTEPFFGMTPDSPSPGPRPAPVTYPAPTDSPTPAPSPTP
ncbi:hypothetical protein QFZ53_003809 [Microbacterium natoriense]|uniref:Lipoprotein n=1 Tax=Microbacterium natoriense TaxID=284570 RepID=A0AAW8F278_9MICO|nr:hypothetical protein [Microbacterium natoriense]MDQ0649613.1 hypothetical protein [Microbacterium natoriense]